MIPASTVQRGSQGTFVYVVDENQTAELRMVSIKNTEEIKLKPEKEKRNFFYPFPLYLHIFREFTEI